MMEHYKYLGDNVISIYQRDICMHKDLDIVSLQINIK